MPYSQLPHKCTHALVQNRPVAHHISCTRHVQSARTSHTIAFRPGRARAGAHAKLICSCVIIPIMLAQNALALAGRRYHYRTFATSNGRDIVAPFNVVITGSTKGSRFCLESRSDFNTSRPLVCTQALEGPWRQTLSEVATTWSSVPDQVRQTLQAS